MEKVSLKVLPIDRHLSCVSLLTNTFNTVVNQSLARKYIDGLTKSPLNILELQTFVKLFFNHRFMHEKKPIFISI